MLDYDSPTYTSMLEDDFRTISTDLLISHILSTGGRRDFVETPEELIGSLGLKYNLYLDIFFKSDLVLIEHLDELVKQAENIDPFLPWIESALVNLDNSLERYERVDIVHLILNKNSEVGQDWCRNKILPVFLENELCLNTEFDKEIG